MSDEQERAAAEAFWATAADQPDPEQPDPDQADPDPADESEPDQPESEQAAPDAAEEQAAVGDLNDDEILELARMAERADEYLALAQRTRADFDNFRKRSARDSALAQQRGIAKLAKELLPAIDNLERALHHAEEEESDLVSGIKLVQADVLAALGRAGIESFAPVGEPFDPQWHEAVAQVPIEGSESGVVVEVYQRGYRLGETVLRPARVLVAA